MKSKIRTFAVLFTCVGLTVAAFATPSKLFKIRKAEAVCCSTVINNGNCSFSGNCFGNPGGTNDCDTTEGNCGSTSN